MFNYGTNEGILKNVPITAVLGDQQASLFGQNCITSGEVKNTYGTGCFALTNTGSDIVHSNNGLLSTVAYQKDGDKPQYAIEGSVSIAGAAVQWLRDNLNIIKESSEVEALAMAEKGSLLNAPDVYMQKIAIGPGCPDNLISLEEDPEKNVTELSKAINKPVEQVTICVLDRPRHDNLIESLRSVGAKVRLIQDGDIAGVIHTTEKSTGIDMYMGIGGAPEGVLAAAALRCIGGQMQTKLVLEDQEKKDRASRLGITDFDKIYNLDDMVTGDALFAATGVTNGSILSGIEINSGIWTHTIVMRSSSKTIRWITAHHQNIDKFNSQD